MSSQTAKTASDPIPVQQTAPTPQLNRSCESCRSLKVRCLPDHTAPNQCQRCAKAKRTCIFVAPQRRRPRKRTDSRVAQLEKEMRQMRSLLKDRLQLDESDGESSGSEEYESRDSDFGTDPREPLTSIQEISENTLGSARQQDPSSSLTTPSNSNMFNGGRISIPPFPSLPAGYTPDLPPGGDVIDRGVVSLDCANSLVAFFTSELSLFISILDLPLDTSASHLRQSKPILFLAIIAAAAIAVDAGLAATLNRELVRLYAEQFFIKGGKSLELIQTLLLMIIFYYPPDSPLEIQFYQYAHIAATMALEIGLASKPRGQNTTNRKSNKKSVYDVVIAEEARTALACYYFASQVAMKTRRPNLLLFNQCMSESLAYLESSPSILDRQVAIWFELQKIVDEALASFGLDDTSATSSLTESRVQAVLRWFDNRMLLWKNNLSEDTATVPVKFEYHYTQLAIYELAVGEGYRDPDAIKQDYYALPRPEGPSIMPLSAIRIDITVKWMNACHEMLDFFLSFDTSFLQKSPNILYTRVGVAIMSLLKIYFSVRSGALGEIITPQTVNAETYLDAMSKRLAEASESQKYRIPSRWHYVIAVKARRWYEQFEQQLAQKETGSRHQVDNTPSVPQTPVHVPSASEFAPTSQQQSMEPLRMHVNMTSMPTFHPMSGTYDVPTGTGSIWSSGQLSHSNFIGVDPFQGYQQSVLAPHFAYEGQPKVLLGSGQPDSSMLSKPNMELDGWSPGQGIYDMRNYHGGQPQ